MAQGRSSIRRQSCLETNSAKKGKGTAFSFAVKEASRTVEKILIAEAFSVGKLVSYEVSLTSGIWIVILYMI